MRQWFYNNQGERNGPIDEDKLISMFKVATLDPSTLVWTKELEGWVKAEAVENLLPDGLIPPPIPPEDISPQVKAIHSPPKKPASEVSSSSNAVINLLTVAALGLAALIIGWIAVSIMGGFGSGTRRFIFYVTGGIFALGFKPVHKKIHNLLGVEHPEKDEEDIF